MLPQQVLGYLNNVRREERETGRRTDLAQKMLRGVLWRLRTGTWLSRGALGSNMRLCFEIDESEVCADQERTKFR